MRYIILKPKDNYSLLILQLPKDELVGLRKEYLRAKIVFNLGFDIESRLKLGLLAKHNDEFFFRWSGSIKWDELPKTMKEARHKAIIRIFGDRINND